MTPMFSTPLTSPWMDGGLFKLRADRFFWHAICFSFMRVLRFEKTGWSSAVFSKSCWVSSSRTCTTAAYL